MNNRNIDYMINILNDTINSDKLNPKIYDLKLRILASVVDKKKHSLKNYMNINNYNSHSQHHSHSQYHSQHQHQSHSQSKSGTSTTPTETESNPTPINDSITASDFTIPSEVYVHRSNGSDLNTDRTNF
jgi:hypothetical protein